jgi:glycosyltransferase involved in cell wall biosynthesis
VDYFVRTFAIERKKVKPIFVGTDPDIFKPLPKRSEQFIVHLHGKYIPLQGIEYVLGAARLLQTLPITFRIIGRGQEYDKIVSRIQAEGLKNIALVDMVPYEELPTYINDSDICLGIFGNSEKTLRVIPNKVVEYLACGKAVITADSPAARELLTDGVHAQFCQAANSDDLAEKILKLYRDPALRKRLGENARQLYLEKLTPQILGKQLAEILAGLV